MSKTIRTKVYSFNELSNDAKKTAVEYFKRNKIFDFIEDEVNETVKKFSDVFHIIITEFDDIEENAIIEGIKANEYYFTQDGKMFNR